MSHSKQALARGYAVLALEPNDNRVLCWSSSDRGPYVNDQPDVRRGGEGAGQGRQPAQPLTKWEGIKWKTREGRRSSGGSQQCTSAVIVLAGGRQKLEKAA